MNDVEAVAVWMAGCSMHGGASMVKAIKPPQTAHPWQPGSIQVNPLQLITSQFL